MNRRRHAGRRSNGSGDDRARTFEALERRTMLAVQPLDIGQFKGRPDQFGAVDGVTLFTTSDFPNGQMLWSTDGTPGGTRLVKDLEPSVSAAHAWFMGGRDNSATVGETFYFTGVDNAHGRELWRSDGTPQGTRLVKDIAPGDADSDPEGFVALGSQLIFSANKQLWRTDGTAEGTYMLKDADPLGAAQPERMAAHGGNVYFMTYPHAGPYDGEHNTGELWRTDGTVTGTVMVRDVSPQPDDPTAVSSVRSGLISVGGALYFAAHDGEHGYELWRSDGTKKGTSLVRDLKEGGDTPFLDGSYPTNLTDVNGTLFFSANGFLYKTNGTAGGTVKLKTVMQPRGFVNANGLLYFVSGENLWVSDGTKPGTRMVSGATVAEHFGADGTGSLNGRLYFGADGGSGFELFETDGTPDRTMLAHEAEPGPASSHAQVLGRAVDKLVFAARSDATALWQAYALDVPAPHSPRDVRLPAEHDSGHSNTDHVTRVRRPTITGSAPPDALVRLFADGTEIGSAVARGGAFRILPSVDLTDGAHTITATSRDDLGRTSDASDPMDVHVDTTPAAVEFKVASPHALELMFSENVSATLTRDDLRLENLATGETMAGDALHVGYDEGANTATITFPTIRNGLSQGEYRLTVDAVGVTDPAGNELSGQASFDFSPPTGPFAGVTRGVLIVNGTAGHDSILVRYKGDDPSIIETVINGEWTMHTAADFTTIRIDAQSGDDTVRFDHGGGVVKIRSSIYAGDGNDDIAGGAHRDRVYGGRGDDTIHGGGGHDIVYGEGGDDHILGERGDDYLVGGAGRDHIRGNRGADRLILETGIDEVMLDNDDQILTDA